MSAPNGYSLFASKVETLFRMNSIESNMTIASTRIIDSSEEGVVANHAKPKLSSCIGRTNGAMYI